MKPLITTLTVLLLAGSAATAQELRSPDGNLRLTFSLDKTGTPTYELRYGDREVIKPSRMGFLLRGKGSTAEFGGEVSVTKPARPTESLCDGFEITDTQTSAFDETWQPVWG